MGINFYSLTRTWFEANNNNTSTSYNNISRPPQHDYFWWAIMVISKGVVDQIHIQLGLLIICALNATPTKYVAIMIMISRYVLVREYKYYEMRIVCHIMHLVQLLARVNFIWNFWPKNLGSFQGRKTWNI